MFAEELVGTVDYSLKLFDRYCCCFEKCFIKISKSSRTSLCTNCIIRFICVKTANEVKKPAQNVSFFPLLRPVYSAFFVQFFLEALTAEKYFSKSTFYLIK